MNRPGLVVGLQAEARIARPLGWPVAVGGGSASGAAAAVQRLVASGATAIVSVGLAGGLDPALRPGFVLVPNRVWTGHGIVATDPALAGRLGGSTGHLLLAGDHVAATASAKAAFRAETGADAVDLETGAALRAARAARLPFAALRAVCDPAERSLPPAALVALDARGAIGLARVLQSVAYDPRQIYALITLAADAWAARAALRRHIRSIQPG